MDKYIVTHDQTVTEFSSLDDAQSFAAAVGVDQIDIQSCSLETPQESADEIFQRKLAQGFPVPNTPYYLAMQDVDRLQFSSMLAMINEAYRYGVATGSSPIEIKDKDGNVLPMTMEGFQQLMIAYGSYYIQIWSERSS